MSYNVLEIANWFLTKEPMTHKKLQKMCYYAQAWYATLHEGEQLINGDFEAWIHGPVHRALYNRYSMCGWNTITPSIRTINLDPKDEEFLTVIFDSFNRFDGDQLEAMTHAENPWKEAREGFSPDEPCNEIIPIESMRKFYTKLSRDNQIE